MTIDDIHIQRALALLTDAFDNSDIFAANRACIDIERFSGKDQAGPAIALCWRQTIERYFDANQNEAGDYDTLSRLSNVDYLTETSYLAALCAARNGAAAHLAQEALCAARALDEAEGFLKRMIDHDCYGIGPSTVDHGQRAMLSSIALALALEANGAGFDAPTRIEFASHFAPWIDVQRRALTDMGAKLFLDHADDFSSLVLDNTVNGLDSFMAGLISNIQAAELDRSIRRPGPGSRLGSL